MTLLITIIFCLLLLLLKTVNCYRFMICCDRCGEWYHGDCVGISVAEGKRMEKSGKEYVCIKCNGQWYMLQTCTIHIMSFVVDLSLFHVLKLKFTH